MSARKSEGPVSLDLCLSCQSILQMDLYAAHCQERFIKTYFLNPYRGGTMNVKCILLIVHDFGYFLAFANFYDFI